MRGSITLFVFLATLQTFSTKYTMSTLNVFDKVVELRQKLRDKIYLSRPPMSGHYKIHLDPRERNGDFENYDYVNEDPSRTQQPIQSKDHLRKEGKGYLKPLVTTPEPQDRRVLYPILRRGLTNETEHPVITRRQYFPKFEELRNQQLPWVMGQVLITPFLTGQQTDPMLRLFPVGVNDHTFLRLMQLLRINTTDYSIEDIRMVLVQISNLKLRLFLWDPRAIKMLLNEIIEGPIHSFRRLKKGVEDLFKRWHLDTSHVGVMLNESRMFRPPCINWRIGGSTQQPTRKTLSPLPPPTTKKICPQSGDDSCEESSLKETARIGEMAVDESQISPDSGDSQKTNIEASDRDQESASEKMKAKKDRPRKRHHRSKKRGN